MLYNNFIVCMMTCAFFALLNMIDNQEWQYIILPIGILIWGIFKFFDADDREYLRRLGIDPDEFNAFFPDDYDGKYRITNHTTQAYNKREDDFNTNLYNQQENHTRYQPTVQTFNRSTWQNPAYKGIVKKCKRNFKITLNEDGRKEQRKRTFYSNGSFGCS